MKIRSPKLSEPSRLSGLSPGRLGPVIGLLVSIMLIGASRVVVFPASIWEQDEAYFSAAVVEIDVADSKPHPPFFPLWIALGKLVHLAGFPPAESLMLIGALVSTVLVIPLTVLWTRMLGPGLALAAAVMALAVPGVWLYSGRAFSGIGATACLVSSLLLWSRSSRWPLAWGSLAAGAAVLVRPQFVLAVVAAAAVVLLHHPRRRWPAIIAPGLVFAAGGATWFIIAAGGLAEVLHVSSLHATQHFGALPTAERGLFDSGLAKVLVSPVVMTMWLALTLLGAITSMGAEKDREPARPVLTSLIALSVVVFGFSNPAHPRYAVPLVILSSGFVVVGLRRLFGGRGAFVVAGALVCWAAAVVLPAAGTCRTIASPPLRALDRAVQLAAERDGVLVVDRGLHAFVGYRQAVGAFEAPVVFDHMLELGAAPPPETAVVMVFDGIDGGPTASSEPSEVFSCEVALLRRLSQDRFLDVTVTAVRSTASQGAEDLIAPLGEGSSGR